MANEKRLIDANAMHKWVEDKVANKEDAFADGVPYEWAYALTAVDMQPTVDAVEVVHGRWEEPYLLYLVCSECGTGYVKYEKYNYCPNCGAKMDGDGNV